MFDDVVQYLLDKKRHLIQLVNNIFSKGKGSLIFKDPNKTVC